MLDYKNEMQNSKTYMVEMCDRYAYYNGILVQNLEIEYNGKNPICGYVSDLKNQEIYIMNGYIDKKSDNLQLKLMDKNRKYVDKDLNFKNINFRYADKDNLCEIKLHTIPYNSINTSLTKRKVLNHFYDLSNNK